MSFVDAYRSGYSILAIVRELERQSIKSPTRNDHWCQRSVDTMLASEENIGYVIVVKTYSNSCPDNRRQISKTKKNNYAAMKRK